MNFLHISKITTRDESIKTEYENEYYMGPWCIDYFDILSEEKKYLVESYMDYNQMQNNKLYTDDVFDFFLNYLYIALNKYNNVNYSISFWKLILSNWLTLTLDQVHFYFNRLKEIDDLGIKLHVYTDTSFPYTTLSQVQERKAFADEEYLHSLLSIIIENFIFKNITFSKKKIINNIDYKRKYIKKSAFILLKKKIYWFFLKKNKARYLLYSLIGTSKFEKFLIAIFFKEFSFSYKEKLLLGGSPGLKSLDYCDDSLNDEFFNIYVNFLKKALPSTLTDNFHLFIDNCSDYKNKKVCLASSGNYQDEQLFELALAKDYGTKVISMEEGADGAPKINGFLRFTLDPYDAFVSWGWQSNNKSKSKIFVTSSSRLSKLLNIHMERFDKILYLTYYLNVNFSFYNSMIIHNPKYLENKKRFIYELSNTKSAENLVVKTHQFSKRINGEEDKIYMKQWGINYSLHNNPKLTVSSCALLYVDYLSTAIYEALVANTPMIICIDEDVTIPSSDLKEIFDDFTILGVVFKTPQEAAIKINEIFLDREKFWHQESIQKVRHKFIDMLARTNKNWFSEFRNTMNKIEMG